MKCLFDGLSLIFLGWKFNKKYVYIPLTKKNLFISLRLQEYGYFRRVKCLPNKKKILIFFRLNFFPFESMFFLREGQFLSFRYRNLVYLKENNGFLLFSTVSGFQMLPFLLRHKMGGILLARFY